MEPQLESPRRRWLNQEDRWLLSLCLARVGFVMIYTAYAAAQPLLMVDWDMSASEAGWVHSVWHLGFLTSLFGVGFLADRYGAKRVFLLSSIGAALGAVLFALLARDFVSGFLFHGLAALFSGGSYTPVLTLISQHVDSSRRGRAVGFYIAASSAGSALSLFLSGVMLELSGWRAAFLLAAGGPVAGLAMACWALRDTPNIVPRPPQGAAGHGVADHGMVRSVLGNGPAMLNIWGYTWHSWELLGMRAWISTFLAAVIGAGIGGSVRAASLGATFAAAMYAAAMGGNIVGGSLSDRWGRTPVILLMSCASLLCSFTLGWLAAAPFWFIVLVGLFYNFTAIADSPVLSTQITELVPPRHLGAAYSVRSVLGFGAGVISPWVFGLVVDWGQATSGALGPFTWGLAFLSLALGGLLGPLGMFKLHRVQGRQRSAPQAAASERGGRPPGG